MIHDENLFIDDIFRDEMLIVLPLTTSIPRGRIKNILLPPIPRGYGIIGPEDIPGTGDMNIMGDSLPFFTDAEVGYEGQTIRLVYGPEEKEVRRLCSGIRVEYETDFTLQGFRDYKPQQILKEKHLQRGKPAKDSDHIRYETDEFKTTLGQPRDNTVFGGFAVPEGKGILVRGASQWPYFIRDTIARGLDMEPSRIIFQGTAGTKGGDSPIWYPALLMFHAALTASVTGKPARIIIPLKESILNCPERAPARFKLKSTIGKEGKVLEREVLVEIDAGAAPVLSDELLDRLCLSVMGAYPLGYTNITARLIKTSNPPLDNFIGLGMAQGFFAVELHESNLAVQLQDDPLERKKSWCTSQGKPFITGGIYNKKMRPEELLEETGRMADFRRKHAAYQLRSGFSGGSFPINPRRGIGVSLGFQGNGFISLPPGKFSVSVRLDADEKVSIRTSSVPAYPRTRVIWKNTAASILQVDPGQVEIENLDTAKVPDSGPALFSNNITVIPRLIEQCCQSILKKRFRAPLPIEIKRTFRLPSARTWNSETFQGQPFISMSWASAAVEVELDPVCQAPGLRGVWMTIDCGRIIDREYARSVIESSIYRTFTDLVTGKVRENQYGGLPAVASTGLRPPLPLKIVFTESREPQPGGIGSLSDNIIPAAFLAAVNQASGIEINRMPFIPGDLLIRGDKSE